MSLVTKLPTVLFRAYQLGRFVENRNLRMYEARLFRSDGNHRAVCRSVRYARSWNRDIVRTLRDLRQAGAL